MNDICLGICQDLAPDHVGRISIWRELPCPDTVPLCRTHHRENRRFGDELVWWDRRAIDPVTTARMLWISARKIVFETLKNIAMYGKIPYIISLEAEAM
jgi:hypothetical protein